MGTVGFIDLNQVNGHKFWMFDLWNLGKFWKHGRADKLKVNWFVGKGQ